MVSSDFIVKNVSLSTKADVKNVVVIPIDSKVVDIPSNTS